MKNKKFQKNLDKEIDRLIKEAIRKSNNESNNNIFKLTLRQGRSQRILVQTKEIYHGLLKEAR